MNRHAQLVQHLTTVTTDLQQSYPAMNAANAASHARNTLTVATLNTDDPTYRAYRAVLRADEGDLAMAVSDLVSAGLDENDVRQSAGGHATIDGQPALEWLEAVFGEDVA